MDLSAFHVTGLNDPTKQVSVDRWNGVLTAIENDVDALDLSSVEAVATRVALAGLEVAKLAVFDGNIWECLAKATYTAWSLDTTYQGLYVASTVDATKTWVRRYTGPVQAVWFGFADGAASNSARLEAIVDIFGTRGCLIQLPTGKIVMDGDVVIDRPVTIIGHGPSNASAVTTAATILEFPSGSSGLIFTHTGGNAGAQGSKVRDLSVYQPTKLDTTGIGSHSATAGNYGTITLSAAGDFVNGQLVRLEGAGRSLTLVGRKATVTSGSNIFTRLSTDYLGADAGSAYGNAVGYEGQYIEVAGAGVAGATLSGYIGEMTSTTFTVVDSSGSAVNASTTVGGAGSAITIRAPLIGRIASGGGTTTLTLEQSATASQSVTNAIIRHADAGIYASCTVHTDNVTSTGFHAGLILHGETTGSAIADLGHFVGGIFAGVWASVVFQGYDAQGNTFVGSNFAGSRVWLDDGFLGNKTIGCHWAFGTIQVFSTGADTVIDGYLEDATAFMAPDTGKASFGTSTTSMGNGAGFKGVASPGGSGTGLVMPATAFQGDVAAVRAYVSGALYVDDIKVIGNQGAAVADATDAASAITQLNALLARARAHGWIAT